ncbi:MAG: hypothetical protein JXA44_05875 [Methanospirillaceae archaeon]|nr:hypothetical protein [Methanospirillaceae archaeon]
MITLPVQKGRVSCPGGRDEPLEKCRFCVHSSRFVIVNREIESPARAFCQMSRATTSVDLSRVTGVVCDDSRGEGYRSILNVIS